MRRANLLSVKTEGTTKAAMLAARSVDRAAFAQLEERAKALEALASLLAPQNTEKGLVR